MNDASHDEEKEEAMLMADAHIERPSKQFIERKSKMMRDLILFLFFFVVLNINLGLRRQVSDLYYLTSTLREAVIERR